MKYIYSIYYYILFLFKNPNKVIIHPRFKLSIKYGFSIGNKHYYRLEHDYEMFENRFRYLKTFYQEVENKLTSKDINDFCQSAIKLMNDGKIVQAGQLLAEMEYRSTWLFEPTSLYKYASVIYFDLQEDIRDYDMMYCHEKIRYWSKKKELLRMLLKELMLGVENLLSLSSEDFTQYISQVQRSIDKGQKLMLEAGLMNSKKTTDETIII